MLRNFCLYVCFWHCGKHTSGSLNKHLIKGYIDSFGLCWHNFFYFCFDYVLYFNFVTDFSLWLTCRAKQFSSADVEGILGVDKDAYGVVKGVRKLAKKSGKVYKKRQKQISLAIGSCQKSCYLPYARGAKKAQKCATSTHK